MAPDTSTTRTVMSYLSCPCFFGLRVRTPARVVLRVVNRLDAPHLSPAWFSEQFGPHLPDNFFREQFKSSDETFRRLLDREAEMHRNGPGFGFPCANIGSMSTDGASQRASASAFCIEVGFKVHATHYSESLAQSNSESHVPFFSVLL